MNATTKKLAIGLAGWAARILVIGVFLLWGAFFVEHLREWFIAPRPRVPPVRVYVFQGLHLLLLLGLLGSLRWARVGLVWVTIAACAFFLPVAGAKALLFVGLTILPVLLVVVFDYLKRANKPPINVFV
jgi:hypothetical protein